MDAQAVQRYSLVAITLHWLIAFMIFGLLAVGTYMTDLPLSDPNKFLLYQYHKSFGLTVLGLSLARLLWRLVHKPPPWPENLSKPVRLMAGATHFALYVLMIAVPLAGWALVSASTFKVPTLWFGVFSVPHLPGLEALGDARTVATATKAAHYYLAMTLLGVAFLHVAAALWHHAIRRDGVLARMLPTLAMLLAGPVVLTLGFGSGSAIACERADYTPDRAFPWLVDSKRSMMRFQWTQQGTTFTGKFGELSGRISFAEKDLKNASAHISVDLSRASTADAQRDQMLHGADWFDVSRQKSAWFKSTAFRNLGEGRYEMDGVLTLKGITKKATIPFTVKIEPAKLIGSKRIGPVATARGSFSVMRSAFGVGAGQFAAGKWIGLDVKVDFEIVGVDGQCAPF